MTVWLGVAAACGLALGARVVYFALADRRSADGGLEGVETGAALTVLALAFEPEDADRRLPGLGNERLALWLAEHAERFSVILAQEAIVWALAELAPRYGFRPHDTQDASLAGHLSGAAVYRMHRHDTTCYVPTLEALCCALGRLRSVPDRIVLVAHDKQFDRACRDLRVRYQGRIVDPGIRHVAYRTESRWLPFLWAVRELCLARPRDLVMRMLGRCACPQQVRLPPVP